MTTSASAVSVVSVEQLTTKLAKLRKTAWLPKLSGSDRPAGQVWPDGQDGQDGPRTVSKFAGLPYLLAAEPWPTCSACGKPMAFLVQLALDTLPEALRDEFGHGLLQLFFCLACAPWEPFSPGALARLIDPVAPAGTQVCPPFPEALPEALPASVISAWKELPAEYPCWDELPELLDTYAIDLGDEEADLYGEEITPAQGDKLSGWPFWAQSTEYPACPTCGQTMRLVLQLDADGALPLPLGDGGIGHITQCPVHKHVLAFGWACY